MRAPYETGGFDLLVQVSEREYNDQLAVMYAAGSTQFPYQVRETFSAAGISGTLNFLFDTPWLHFGTDPQNRTAVSRYDWRVSDAALTVREDDHISLFLPFSEAFLDITDGATLNNIDGCVMVQHPVTVTTPADRRNLREVSLDFASGAERVEVGLTPETDSRLAATSSVLATLLRAEIQNRVSGLLQDRVGQIALSPQPIRVFDDDDPTTPESVSAAVLRAGDRALGFALPTRAETSGDVNRLAESETDAGTPVVVLFDADTLLAEVIRPALANGIGVPPDRFARPCRLSGTVDLDTSTVAELDDLDLEGLRARIVDDYIRVDGSFDGHGDYKGFPFSVEGDFRLRIYIELRNGRLDVRLVAEDPDVDVDFPAWVYIVATGLGVLTGGVAGAAIGATAVLIAELIADALADSIVAGFLGSALGAVGDTAIPLGPAADSLELTAVELTEDALALGGAPAVDAAMPVAARSAAGDHGPGTAVDLDHGDVFHGRLPDGVDLQWGYGPEGLAIYARSGAAFATLSGSFETLSVVDLEQAEFEANPYGTAIPASVVPWDVDTRFIDVDGSLVFAVRTSENRYAKCRVARRLDGGLSIEFLTYDRPTPRIDISFTQTVVEREEIESGTESVPVIECVPSFGFGGGRYGGGIHTESRSSEYTIDAVAREISVTAGPVLLADPIRSVAWTLEDVPLSGSGRLTIDGDHRIEYAVTSDGLDLRTEKGETFAATIGVEMVDDRGLAVTADRHVRLDGTVKEGGMTPADVADARQAVDQCMTGPIERGFGPGGARPDPLPPWTLVDLLEREIVTDPERMLPGDGEPEGVDLLDQLAGSGSFVGSRGYPGVDLSHQRIDTLRLDETALRAALRRGRENDLQKDDPEHYGG